MPDAFAVAVDHFRRGQWVPAERAIRAWLEHHPNHAESRALLGAILGSQRRWVECRDCLAPILAAGGDRPEVLHWLATAHRNLGELASGLPFAQRAVEMAPRNGILQNELGLYYMALGRASDAATAFQAATRANPLSAEFAYNLGVAYARLDWIFRAKSAFEEALRLAPGMARAAAELADLLITLETPTEAVRVLATAIDADPTNLELHTRLANAYNACGDARAVEEIFDRLLLADPATGAAFGLWLQEQGRFGESVAHLLTSLSAEPNQGAALYGLAEARVFTTELGSVAELAARQMTNDRLPRKERMYAAYAAARSEEGQGEYEAAMAAFVLANRLAFDIYGAGRPYDVSEVRRRHERAVQVAERVRPGEIGDGPVPVLIFGMIRSGTTLLDQILARHSRVASAGEPAFWLREGDALLRRDPGELSAVDPHDLCSRYLQSLRGAARRESAYNTDKMPLNSSFTGVIHRIVPQARLIHLRRNPLDTALSIFTTFLGHGPPFAYDAERIVDNYLAYLDGMAQWRQTLPPGAVLEVDYEALVSDPRPVVERVLAFVGLPWEDACLGSEETGSAIRTPSRWQARQAINTKSVARAERFAPWLGALARLQSAAHPSLTD